MTVASAPYRQPTRRWTELALLLLAFCVGAFAYVQVDLAVTGAILPSTAGALGVVAVTVIAAHLAVRAFAPYADPLLLPLAAALNLLGLVMIHRLDLADALRATRTGTEPPGTDIPGQLTWTVLGLALCVATVVIVRDHRKLQRYTYTALLAGVILLLLPLVPFIGVSIRGATLWVGIAGYSFQPGELAKIALTIFLAGYLAAKRDTLALVRTHFLGLGFPRGRDLGPLLVAWAVSLAILVFETDLGSSLLFFGLAVCLLYVATSRRSWLVLGAVLFITGAAAAYLAFGHVRVRFDLWLHPFDDPQVRGYQIVQSLYGFASGGIFGSGLGQGYPQLVPFAKSDFIVAAFGEEIGMVGLFAMLVLYALLVQRGLRTATACRDPFGALLAAGLSIVTALQVFIVVGGVSRLIPLTGLTTPFLSQGGSSLVANWIIVGLMLRISDAARRPVDTIEVASNDAALVTTVVRR